MSGLKRVLKGKDQAEVRELQSVSYIAPGVYFVPLGYVNSILIEDDGGPIIVDTGMPNSATKILDGLQELGYMAEDVQKIIVTHKHIDHAGGLAALKQETKAPAVMHPVDAASVRNGESLLPVTSAPGLFSKIMAASMRLFSAELEPANIEEEIFDGDWLPLAGGIEVIHTPGHSAGQISLFLPRDGGMLIVADAAINVMGLRVPPFFEDMEEGMDSLRRLSVLDFDTAVFMHGKPLIGGASKRFFEKWSHD